ncbi:hypothetical protein H4696_009150 [Amycolatopsis lexingtonensis]|uniref:Pectate lyase superfamily protein domain-containing protein n=1 Tax=Amycolatopsis lexingtonensis TaxID=218822 RepID=A0ABR9IFU5_9PSEU|nr:hypothetical protein [Amycolatopsis lexingtonensis]
MPFRTVEAECSATNGSAVGPDYTQGSIASEASGRQAVRITTGQYVEFTLPVAANSINVHYNLPDGSSGRLSVSVNGSTLALPVTSRYTYVDTGFITGSKTHHFFDDARLLLGQNLAAGTKVRVQAGSGDVGQATIDLADFEQVGGAGSKPADALSVTDYGATANDSSDDTQAFRNALSAARSQGREVWVPSGRFEIGSALQIDQTTVRGAGPWYTVLHGNNIFNNGSASGNIKLYDFAVFGDVTERNDGSPDNAFHGVLGNGSVVSGLWIQDTKCGLWLMNGASSNLTIENKQPHPRHPGRRRELRRRRHELDVAQQLPAQQRRRRARALVQRPGRLRQLAGEQHGRAAEPGQRHRVVRRLEQHRERQPRPGHQRPRRWLPGGEPVQLGPARRHGDAVEQHGAAGRGARPELAVRRRRAVVRRA